MNPTDARRVARLRRRAAREGQTFRVSRTWNTDLRNYYATDARSKAFDASWDTLEEAERAYGLEAS